MKTGIIVLVLVMAIVLIVAVGSLLLLEDDNSGSNTSKRTVRTEGSGSIGMPVEGSNVPEMVVTENPKTYSIDIEDFAFKTKTLTVKKGDTVVWTNRDSAGHTVTSDSGNELDSELLSRGKRYLHTFTKTGTFNYHCEPHPYMKGMIIVE